MISSRTCADVDEVIPASYRKALAGRRPEGPPQMAMSGDQWLRELPALIDHMLARWDLQITGPARHGVAALVYPVRTPQGPAAFKVIWPHPEAATEHRALRHWKGIGAVRLLAADPHRWALLLEAAEPDVSLEPEPIFDACEQIGALLRTLAVPALPTVPSLADTAAAYAAALEKCTAIGKRMVQQAISLCSDLTADGGDTTLLHTDLHFANVLRSRRPEGGWLSIDPQAQNAELAFGVAPVLWNRWALVASAHSPRTHLRARVDAVCDAGGIDADRARGWTIVREAMNALWAQQDGDADAVTRAVTIIKAMQG